VPRREDRKRGQGLRVRMNGGGTPCTEGGVCRVRRSVIMLLERWEIYRALAIHEIEGRGLRARYLGFRIEGYRNSGSTSNARARAVFPSRDLATRPLTSSLLSSRASSSPSGRGTPGEICTSNAHRDFMGRKRAILIGPRDSRERKREVRASEI